MASEFSGLLVCFLEMVSSDHLLLKCVASWVHWWDSESCFKDTYYVYLQKCAEIIVAHLGYLNYTQYTVIVGFEHLERPIKEMNFTVSIPADLRYFYGSFI